MNLRVNGVNGSAKLLSGSGLPRGERSTLPEVDLFGTRVHRASMEVALREAGRFLEADRFHLIVTADTSMIEMGIVDTALREIVNSAALVVPDSIGVVWAARRFGAPVPERVPGVELMERLCDLAASTGRSVFLLGAAPGVAEEAARRLTDRYPDLSVAGTYHGYLTPEDTAQVEAIMAASRPDILFVAMGIPAQEKWIAQRIGQLPARIAVGVGGSFDCFSGRVTRAPKLFQRLNLEWLYRLAANPRKYRKGLYLPRFAARVLGATMFHIRARTH